MTEWIEFRHNWAYYITSDTLTFNKVTGKVPEGSIVLTKEQEILDTGVTITNTDYSLAKNGEVVSLADKRSASKILALLFVNYMKKHGEYPPGASFGKSYKNGNVDVDFQASDYDKFVIRLTSEEVKGDPEEFLMRLNPASKKKFIPQDDWKIEPAKSSRSTCKTCGHSIEKSELRLGEPTYFQDHLNYKWHHFNCMADDIWGVPESKLDGYSSLTDEEKDIVKKALWK